MTDEEKQAMGVYYQIDEQRRVIIYDPRCNHEGKWDDALDKSVENMSMIAKREGMTVEATFNGTTFQMTPEMSPQGGMKEYEKQCEIAYEAYKKTPEYKARQEAAAKKEAARKAQKLLDDKLIKDEVLDVSGFTRHFEHMKEINSDSLNKSIIEYAIRWGKLMQAEMKKQGLDHLTKELVENTDMRADIYGMSGASASCGRNLLIVAWKYGKELGKINGFKEEEIDFAKAYQSDRAYEFYDKYRELASEPKDSNDALTKAGYVIATVFQDEKLVNMFYEKLADPRGIDEEEMRSYIPVLKLPSREWQSLYVACSRANREIEQKNNLSNENSTSIG